VFATAHIVEVVVKITGASGCYSAPVERGIVLLNAVAALSLLAAMGYELQMDDDTFNSGGLVAVPSWMDGPMAPIRLFLTVALSILGICVGVTISR